MPTLARVTLRGYTVDVEARSAYHAAVQAWGLCMCTAGAPKAQAGDVYEVEADGCRYQVQHDRMKEWASRQAVAAAERMRRRSQA